MAHWFVVGGHKRGRDLGASGSVGHIAGRAPRGLDAHGVGEASGPGRHLAGRAPRGLDARGADSLRRLVSVTGRTHLSQEALAEERTSNFIFGFAQGTAVLKRTSRPHSNKVEVTGCMGKLHVAVSTAKRSVHDCSALALWLEGIARSLSAHPL